MTSRTIFVKGRRIDPEAYGSYHGTVFKNSEDFKVFGSDRVFIVSKEYDSVDLEDYDYFTADAFFDVGDSYVLDVVGLSSFLSDTTILSEKKPYHIEEGFFNSRYDMDRKYRTEQD